MNGLGGWGIRAPAGVVFYCPSVYTLLMFRGKKWERYAKKETSLEKYFRRRAAVIKGHKTRRLKRLLLGRGVFGAATIASLGMLPVVNESDLPENK